MKNEFIDDEIDEQIDFSEYYEDKTPKKHNKMLIPIIVAAVIILVVICVVSAIVVERMRPNNNYADLYTYYGVKEDSVSIIYNGELLSSSIKIDDRYYLEMDFVYDNLNNRFYYDESLDSLLYTTATEIYTIPFASFEYTINEDTQNSDYYIAVQENDLIYISLDFISDKAPVTYIIESAPERIVLISDDTSILPLKFSKDAVIRTGTSIKKEILAKPVNELWYEIEKDCKSGWMAVANMDGRRGYVQDKYVTTSDTEYVYHSGYENPVYENCVRDYNIVLVWNAIYNTGANSKISGLLKKTDGVTTVSPTWYKVANETGEIRSMADKEYVEYVQSLGMEVWPLIDDFTSTEGDGWSNKELFGNADNRRFLIDNIINEIKYLECEGVNIDFEYITDEVSDDYAQFMRELSIRCREENIVLSVDTPVPKPYNMKYQYDVLGECVDYLMVMGYDEYSRGGGIAGPVASYTFEKEGIEEALKMVPAQKLISGVPFYTRMWEEYVDEKGALVLTASTYYMEAALNAIEDLGLNKSWNEEMQLYEASGTVDGVYYRIWLEEENSMAAKMQLVTDNDLGGVAAWALGMEMESIWNVIVK